MLEFILSLYPNFDKIYGPYQSGDGRWRIVLYKTKISKNSNSKKRTISYPKALMEIKLKRRLDKNEEVHHKDEDYTNNDEHNLEILTGTKHRKLHIKKDAFHRQIKTYCCPTCNKLFQKRLHQIRNNQESKKKKGPFCSRQCAGIYGQKQQKTFRKSGTPNQRRSRPFKKLAVRLHQMRK